MATAALLLTIRTFTSPEVSLLLTPTLAAVAVFVMFAAAMQGQLGGNLFGEIGFVYLGWAVVYTLVPGLGLAWGSADDTSPLALLLPAPEELGTHLWRHVLFIASVAMGYLLARGNHKIPERIEIADPAHSSHWMVAILLGVIVACILCMLLLSAPVTNYYEHYVRYEHLAWPVRKFISLCVRLNIGFYSVLLVLLFLNYQKYRWLIVIVVIAICVHETTYSLGSRILSLMILLQVACLYHLVVRKISLARGLAVCLLLGVLFTALEFLRETEFDLGAAQSRISDEGLKTAGEFGAVFLTGFHLYAERAQGSLPPTDWPMFFSDFVSLVTFNDFTLWNPMEWYARNYYPEAVVAPMTLSPIADSAIWGGETDLFLRGLVNGAFFAAIVRCFLRFRDKWWSLLIYVFCHAASIITLKYSVFYLLTPLLKTMLPALLVFAFIRRISPAKPAHAPPA